MPARLPARRLHSGDVQLGFSLADGDFTVPAKADLIASISPLSPTG